MSQITKIQNQWIEELFQNQTFTQKLTSFLKQTNKTANQTLEFKTAFELQQISQEISTILSEHILNQTEQRYEIIDQEIKKINNEISILKNYIFGCSLDKQEQETTCYKNSKLQISSILQQDNAFDLSEIKSTLTQIQQRFDFWFGKNIPQKQTQLDENSNLSIQVMKKCSMVVQNLDTQIKKKLQNTDLIVQRRIDLISKTLNNVLEMINENPNKPEQTKTKQQNLTTKQSLNTNSLVRQSSLQNMKIKNFFTFGNR